MMSLLLDENISPALVPLFAQVDVYSQSVPHVGLAGRADHVIRSIMTLLWSRRTRETSWHFSTFPSIRD